MRSYIKTYGGNGYFELGSTLINSGTIFKFKATPRVAPEGFWLGNWSYWYGIYHPIQSGQGNMLKWYSTGSREGVFYQGTSQSDILDHAFEIEVNTDYVKVNGTTVSRTAPVNETFPSFHVGNAANASSFDAKQPVEWEYFQIWQDGVLTLDLVPAYHNNQYCFKDKVSGNYLYATGTVDGEVSSFDVDTTEIEATSAGTAHTVSVSADTGITWTASTNDTWITLSPTTGDGNGTLNVTIPANDTYNPRSGEITLISSESDTIIISVSQKKKAVILERHDMYRGANVIKKMYKNGELIYQRVIAPI